MARLAQALMSAAALAAVPAAQVSAQGAPPAASPATATRRPNLSVQFGWDGSMPAERFGPMWVTVDPGSRTIDGTVSVLVPQDAVQQARLVAPFAAAPGRPARVEFTVCLPPSASRVVVEVRSAGGGLVARQVLSNAAFGSQLNLPPGMQLYDDVVASVGVPGLVSAAKAWTPGSMPVPTRQSQSWAPTPPDQTKDLFEHVMVTPANPAELPTAWAAYDGLRCLVIDASQTRQIPPAAVRAIKDWVQDGGRLVLMADDPGAEWIGWIDEAAQTDALALSSDRPLPIMLADVARIETPAGMTDVVVSAPRDDDSPLAAVASPQVPIRGITITPLGESLGWQGHWAIVAEMQGDSAAQPEGQSDNRRFVLAEGPVGFGHVCVIGVDPSDVVLGVDRLAVAHLWKHALAGAMDPFRPSGDRRDVSVGWMIAGSGDHMMSRAGITGGLDHLADFRVPSGSIFYVVAGACFVLALLVGPVDAIVLKRLGKRQASWLSALAWIGGASILAWAIPAVGSSGEGRLSRLSVIDQVHDQLGSPALGRQTALTGIFSARAGNAALETQDPTAIWRGVSSVTTYYFNQRQPETGSPITLAAMDVPRPDRATGPAATGASVRTASLRSVPMPMWTFRTLMERGQGSLPVVADIDHDGDGNWRVALAGMPEGATIEAARLCVAGRQFDLDFDVDPATGHLSAQAEAGSARVPSPPNDVASTPVDPWFPIAQETSGGVSYSYPSFPGAPALTQAPGFGLRIMGPDARGEAIDNLVRSGRWALLCLHIENAPMDAASRLTDTSRRTVIARLIVPLEEPIPPRATDRWAPSPRRDRTGFDDQPDEDPPP